MGELTLAYCTTDLMDYNYYINYLVKEVVWDLDCDSLSMINIYDKHFKSNFFGC